MIESSFCILSGVGLRTERRWWQRGIGTWNEFLSSGTIPGIGPIRRAVYNEELGQAQAHRAEEDARYFGNRLLRNWPWRGASKFFLDVWDECPPRCAACGFMATVDAGRFPRA